MAYGIEAFRLHFKGYQNQYVLIGGMACDLLLNEAGVDFRPTKDIDMVLIVEVLRLIKNAGFKYPSASIESLDYDARQVKKSTIMNLATMGFKEILGASYEDLLD